MKEGKKKVKSKYEEPVTLLGATFGEVLTAIVKDADKKVKERQTKKP